MKIVLAIFREGNLSKAARALSINQSTVSRRLSSLEMITGMTLFLKEKNVLQPTLQGRALINECEQIESTLLKGFERLGNIEAQTRGSIQVVSTPWICNSILASNLNSFHENYPGIEIQIVADSRERFLDLAEAEVALRFEMKPRGRIMSIPLVDIPYSIYARFDKDPKELPWIGFKEQFLHFEPEKWIKSTASSSQIRFWANDASVIHNIIRSGAGKGLIPDFLGKTDSKLVRVSKNKPELVRTLHIQVIDEVYQLKRVSVFIQWLTDVVARI